MRRWLVAAVFSGVPSTVHTLATGGDVLESTRAAGTLLGRRSVVRGAVAHLAISGFWTWVLLRAGAAGRPVRGAVGGLAITALDLGVVGRRYPDVAALPTWPQVADHVAFGVLVSVGIDVGAGGVTPTSPRRFGRASCILRAR